VTLVEFLDPVRRGNRREQVLGVLYYFKHEVGQEGVSIGEIRQGLIDARVPQARTIKISNVLNAAAPYTNRVGPRGIWTLTGRGDDFVREQLGLDFDTPEAQHDVRSLEALAASISEDTMRDYIEEAIKCLQVDAKRAAVVFLWAGAVATLREAAWAKARRPTDIDTALKAHNRSARKFTKKGDFDYVNDASLLQLCFDVGVLDRSEKKQLGQALDLRNDCGHPVKYRPGEKKVSSFIEDVVSIVFT
jgi:hypothetical protein